ncbi:hypothetical protein [Brucella inopinata]|uniref:hypothetical protein n=1 Tax=Brucella inopinata TaxID=1218315 RepID=UPI000870C7DE|nr:hypothetical protein [Brucella inopinata]SCD25534.1 hypothetical protein BR141012304_21075 [Brucella inopinata]
MTTIIPTFRPDGSLMNLAQPVEGDIHWPTIAGALSKIARFNGFHSGPMLSVAQHCVMGADALASETGNTTIAAFFLLHDAHEALIGDWSRPAVLFLADTLYDLHNVPMQSVREAVEAVKARLDQAIYRKAGLPPHVPFAVKQMDERMLRAETLALFGKKGLANLNAPELPMPKLTGAIKPWAPMKAEEAWLSRLSRYLGIDWRAAA